MVWSCYSIIRQNQLRSALAAPPPTKPAPMLGGTKGMKGGVSLPTWPGLVISPSPGGPTKVSFLSCSLVGKLCVPRIPLSKANDGLSCPINPGPMSDCLRSSSCTVITAPWDDPDIPPVYSSARGGAGASSPPRGPASASRPSAGSILGATIDTPPAGDRPLAGVCEGVDHIEELGLIHRGSIVFPTQLCGG